MIGINKIQTIKQETSVLIICNGESINRLSEGIVSKAQVNYIQQEYKENKTAHFSFNELNRYIILDIIQESGIIYKDKEKYRRLGAKTLQLCDDKNIKDLQLAAFVHKDMILSFVEGMLLASYVFDKYKTDPKRLIHPFDNLHLCCEDVLTEDINELRIVCEATEKCRDLVNEPVTVINATTLAESIQSMALETGMKAEILGREQI